MKDKILDKIAEKFDLSEEGKEKIKKFRKIRVRMINMKIKSGKIGKFKLFLITQFLTFLSCGKIRTAQGTIASFLTILLWFFTTSFFSSTQFSIAQENLFWAGFIIISTFFAILLTPIYTRNFAEDDHPSIVIDEVVGQLIALCLTYPFIRQYYQEEPWLLTKIIIFGHLSLCFLFFRVIDIAKPSFVGWIDRNMKNPFGVMLDDIIAGLLTASINIFLFMFYKKSILELQGY